MTSRRQIAAIAIALASVFGTACRAELVVYTDRSEWLAAVSGTPTLEDFNSRTTDFDFGGGTLTVGDVTLSSNADQAFEAKFQGPTTPFPTGFVDGSTSFFAARGLDLPTDEFISISIPASSAVAFEYNNFDTSGGSSPTDSLRLSVVGTPGGDGVFDLERNTNATTDGTLHFVGIVDTSQTTFTELRLSTFPGATGGSGVFIGFDNVEYGISAIPEPLAPLTLGLVVSGIGVMAGRRRSEVRGS